MWLWLLACTPDEDGAPVPSGDDDDDDVLDDTDPVPGDDDDDDVPSGFTAVWWHSGGDKVPRDELRDLPTTDIVLHGARNEVVAFALVLEAGDGDVGQVDVRLDRLDGPGGGVIQSTSTDVFDWVDRPIERFVVDYLPIRGLSRLAYETYDERHVPERFRRPWTGDGQGSGGWTDRPDHDREYPDIAVPIEVVGPFDVEEGHSQLVWFDVYLPKTATPGDWTGNVEIYEAGTRTHAIPVTLEVHDFALPDAPAAKTMLYTGYADVNTRYLGVPWPNTSADLAASTAVIDRHFQMAHRHRIALIGDDNQSPSNDRPSDPWIPRLDGSLFTEAHGYGGPGEGVGNGVYSIATYGSWTWSGEAEMQAHADAWEGWFVANSPETDRFLYLIDESLDYPQIEQWAKWVATSSGPGAALPTFATMSVFEAVSQTPSLTTPCTIAAVVGDPASWQTALDTWATTPGKSLCFYNGMRPWSGSFATEDDGVALRVTAWTQHKHGIDRWFYWESTYYDNFQGGAGDTDVWSQAQTFGTNSSTHVSVGETGWNYTNGDGVLFYPGTDTVFPASSLGLDGPVASLRLKHWRRGIQDADYLALAAAKDPAATEQIVAEMLPTSLYEYGQSDPSDPTWVRTDISWSRDPADWEAARRALATIIAQ